VGARGWKTIAWNGLRFAIPGDWEPARIGPRHLLFESGPGPVMEIKWAAVKGRFYGRRRLRELSRRVARKGAAFQTTALPAAWRAPLAGFDAQGFQWDAGNERAVGVLLYCPACRTASMIQFLGPPAAGRSAGSAALVLASFRDHRSDGRVAWALYDIAALLPHHFALGRHRFEAGRFVLEFQGPGRRLALYRWAPAGVLLRDRSLTEFAETVAGGRGMAFLPLASAGHPTVEGRDPSPDGAGGRLLARLGMSWFRRLRLWHVSGRNRILGIRVEGRRPIDDAEMTAMSDAYGMADEKRLRPPAKPQ
jgi:hypothetical protein